MFLRARSVQRTACNILALIRIDFLIAESHSHTLPNLRITPYFQVFAKSTLLLKTSNIMSESFKKTKKNDYFSITNNLNFFHLESANI